MWEEREKKVRKIITAKSNKRNTQEKQLGNKIIKDGRIWCEL